VFASSLYFGLFHFIDPQPLPDGQGYHWWSGLLILAGAFQPYTQPMLILDSLAALTVAGMLLAMVREYRRNILFALGMHAGWVFVLKILRSATDLNKESTWAWGVGSYDQVTGWISVCWLGLVVLGYVGWRRRRGGG
jgi:membrane protease YdiL (CAAX protease family)